MTTFLRLLATVVCVGLPLHAQPAKPLYQDDFESAEVAKPPREVMIMAGAFAVRQTEAGKVLELPGEPLDTFGMLFGPTHADGVAASARFFGTRQGRKFPTFAVSLNGVGGYRLQISPAKKALEIYKGDTPLASVPHEWASGAWTQLRVQVQKGSGGTWIVSGKAWSGSDAEPAQPSITFEDKQPPPPGRAGLWGSPYSGTPIQFDDLLVTAVQPS
jgi:hypothetical protein